MGHEAKDVPGYLLNCQLLSSCSQHRNIKMWACDRPVYILRCRAFPVQPTLLSEIENEFLISEIERIPFV